MLGAFLAFYAFIGFEDLAHLGDEAQDAVRSIPRAIFFTLGVSLLLYLLVSAAAVATLPAERLAESRAPLVDLVRGSADWLGINYYTPARVDLDDGVSPASTSASVTGGDAGVEEFPGVGPFRFTPRPPFTDIGWEVEPRGLEELLVTTHARTGLPLVVTENGAAFPDQKLTPDGAVDDQDRIDYVRDHVAAVHRAREQGADVRGYVLWTLMDNFEWAEGYTKHFGVVHVDRDTLVRMPKASYHWFAEMVRASRE
jgi:beta-glucosidase